MSDTSGAAAAAAAAAEGEANRRRTTSFVDPALAENVTKDEWENPLEGAMHGMNVKDDSTLNKVKATPGYPETVTKEEDIAYTDLNMIGNGSFGVVFKTSLVNPDKTKRTVALKKVLQDRRYKNRELEIMRMVKHHNIVELLYFFFTPGQKEDMYLNLIMEFLPISLSNFSESYNKRSLQIPILYIRLSVYQMLRALGYLHGRKICHRDIKPQNLLINVQAGVLKLCDFGCAKVLSPDQPNVSYICSRYYRAPELCFGAQMYTHSIDVWSAGCVLAELMMGSPIFRGSTTSEQLYKIIKIMGTPSREQIKAMNPSYTKPTLPSIPAKKLEEVFRGRVHNERDLAVDLLKKMFEYVPSKRLNCMECIAHPFFDQLRNPEQKLSNGQPLPELFNFSPEELSLKPSIEDKIIPPHARG